MVYHKILNIVLCDTQWAFLFIHFIYKMVIAEFQAICPPSQLQVCSLSL